MIDGARLKQAREAISLTQVALAQKSGILQSDISRLEMGMAELTNEEVRRLADALEVPVNFFFRSPIRLPDGSLGLFRSLSSKVKSTEYRAARRAAELGVESLFQLSKSTLLPPVRVQSIPDAEPEEAAVFARSMLRLPADDPIDNVTAALERSGVFVLRLSDISEHIIGFSAWIDPVPGFSEVERPLIVARRPMSAFRLRFTLGHELGHIILRHQVFSGPSKPAERDANRFSQAFLMPKEAALEDLSVESLNIERLAYLKGKWGVSMHAIAMRAKALGVIDEYGYRNIYENLRYKGYLKREPGDLSTPSEQPRLLPELLKRQGVGNSVYDIAHELNFGISHVRRLIGDENTDMSFDMNLS